MTDLISTAVGGRVVSFNDEFFAPAANLIKPEEPVWREGEFTDQGKWMDGWETRRRREQGYDWCVLALGLPGRVQRVTIDTSHFTGNYPEHFSMEACGVGADEMLGDAYWVPLIPKSPLDGDSRAVLDVTEAGRVTHVRLNIFPDGGVARLRVEGMPIPSKEEVCPDSGILNLAGLSLGTEPVNASDAHYSPPVKMLRPADPEGMWDGWETKRRRGPGNDWVEFELGLPGMIEEVVADTRYFKGNSPGWVSLEASDDGETWRTALPRVEVRADTVNELVLPEPVSGSHVRLDIYPDGGMARLRVLGRPHEESAVIKRMLYVNALFGQEATRFFHTACSSTRWVSEMLGCRPFDSAAGLLDAAELSFVELDEEDWLEAFAGHPRIGDRGDASASREQSGTAGAGANTLASLNSANENYEEKFGFTYIVYATGKSADEMLEIAMGRLANTRDQEVDIAAGEQRKITRTRLRRMLCMGDAQ